MQILLWSTLGLLITSFAFAHGVAEGDANFLQSKEGLQFWPYFYLGAKHMVTGYDHLLFIGHSLTLITGVWLNIAANAYLVDAVIGFSVVYKAFDNLGGCSRLGLNIPPEPMVFVFGLIHGFGLATKLQELALDPNGLIGNLLAFNIGVEVGQLLALLFMLLGLVVWRRSRRFTQQAIFANIAIMLAGLLLIGYQLSGYYLAH